MMDKVHRILRDIRIIPVVLVAIGALLTLKLTGLFTGTGYVLVGGSASEQRQRQAQDRAAIQSMSPQSASDPAAPARVRSWAQDVFNYPDVTGSVSAPKPAPPADKGKAEPAGKDAAKDATKTPKEPERKPDGRPVMLAEPKPVSAAERALLERLSERRQELEQRAREIEMRETLMQAAEQKLQARTNELKDIESRIVTATQKKEEMEQSRLKSLVTMYESMKAKDAAKIFDRLDIKLATQVANLINPRRMSDIMAQMSPETAERLTVELSRVGTTAEKPQTPNLPKIEGRPPGT
jgi:flagellar motility protein MotE (MotC chaperone)